MLPDNNLCNIFIMYIYSDNKKSLYKQILIKIEELKNTSYCFNRQECISAQLTKK